jgi:hypothetical protein
MLKEQSKTVSLSNLKERIYANKHIFTHFTVGQKKKRLRHNDFNSQKKTSSASKMRRFAVILIFTIQGLK